jgi:predicted negative regulator of RcsB-dependent stress response
MLSFSTNVPQKQETTQKYQKQISSVCRKFSAQTSRDRLTNLETSNSKTHKTKVVGLLFLFPLDIWIAYFGSGRY